MIHCRLGSRLRWSQMLCQVLGVDSTEILRASRSLMLQRSNELDGHGCPMLDLQNSFSRTFFWSGESLLCELFGTCSGKNRTMSVRNASQWVLSASLFHLLHALHSGCDTAHSSLVHQNHWNACKWHQVANAPEAYLFSSAWTSQRSGCPSRGTLGSQPQPQPHKPFCFRISKYWWLFSWWGRSLHGGMLGCNRAGSKHIAEICPMLG